MENFFDIEIVFWNKGEDKIYLDIEKTIISEIQIVANQTNPLKRLPQTYRFIRRAYAYLCTTRADVVYVGNLDMLLIAYKYKRCVNPNSEIIYEVADLHRLIVDKQKGIKKIVSIGLKALEKRIIKCVSLIVLTSMKYYDAYYCKLVDADKIVFLPNMPDDMIFSGYVPKKRIEKPFTIGFIGWIRYKNQLKMLIDASGKAGCNVLFAGSDGEGVGFKEYCDEFSFVTFLGSYDYEKSIRDLYDMIDCTYAVYDADWTNVRLALPNKVYETIACEKPIIVAKNTYLSEMVTQYGVGVEVDHRDSRELLNVINRLKKRDAYYYSFVENCKKAKGQMSLSYYNDLFINKLLDIIKTDRR